MREFAVNKTAKVFNLLYRHPTEGYAQLLKDEECGTNAIAQAQQEDTACITPWGVGVPPLSLARAQGRVLSLFAFASFSLAFPLVG